MSFPRPWFAVAAELADITNSIPLEALESLFAASAERIEYCTMPVLYLGTSEFETEIEKVARTRLLIVIDSLKAATPGAEENDSSMRMGLDQLRRVSERTGCVFVVLVHAKKKGSGKEAIDLREILRGSSAIFDAADGAFVVLCTKGKPLRIDQTKSRHGKAVEPFEVTIVDQPDGGIVLEATDAIPEVMAGVAKEKFEATVSKVVDIIAEHPGCITTLVRSLVDGVRSTVVSGVLEYLEDKRRIENRGAAGNGKSAAWYSTLPV